MQQHQHVVVSPGNGLFYCLVCGNELTASEANSVLAADNYGELPAALALSAEQLEQLAQREVARLPEDSSAPINDEYCWMHSGPGYGGWTCKHPECRSIS